MQTANNSTFFRRNPARRLTLPGSVMPVTRVILINAAFKQQTISLIYFNNIKVLKIFFII